MSDLPSLDFGKPVGHDGEHHGLRVRTAAEQAQVREQYQEKRREVARHVLWFNGDARGYEPGSFTSKLLEAWTRADQENAARLALAFPLLGQAVEISRTQGSDALAQWGGLA